MVVSNTSKQDGKQKNSLDPSFFSDLYFKYAFFPRQPASLPIWCHLVASDTGVARPLVHPHRLTHNQQGLTLCCNISFRDYSETNLMCSIQAKKVKIIAEIVCSLTYNTIKTYISLKILPLRLTHHGDEHQVHQIQPLPLQPPLCGQCCMEHKIWSIISILAYKYSCMRICQNKQVRAHQGASHTSWIINISYLIVHWRKIYL